MKQQEQLVTGDSSNTRVAARRVALDIARTSVQMVLILVVFSAVLSRFVIQQTSMEPNFHEGQRIVVSKLGTLWSDWFVGTAHAANAQPESPFSLQRGQIVVFYDNPTHQGDPLIKRVVGIPGDTLAIHDGAVFVNGQPLSEPYLHGLSTDCTAVCGPFTLAQDEYFVMGDNRPVSRDSRSFGTVPISQVVGRVVLRYWPFDQIAFF